MDQLPPSLLALLYQFCRCHLRKIYSTPSRSTSDSSDSFSGLQLRWNGDVFLSFRGEDTRLNFTDHLYMALSNSGISTFKDSEGLQRGEEISPSLLNAIEGAKLSIVVFSETYVQSRWCLDELVKIMECRATGGQMVIPVFYRIDPSVLRRQSGVVATALKFSDNGEPHSRVAAWRKALFQATNIAGFAIDNFGSEADHIKRIVKEVSRRIYTNYLVVADYPVGMESRVCDMLQRVRIESHDVLVIGIWGMGGIGKTTIAKATYNKICHEFEVKSFIANVKDAWEQFNGRVHLQEQLLSDMLQKGKTSFPSVKLDKVLSERLCEKKVLLVLDDIDDLEQIKALCGSRKWFGPGSRVIITTRDIHVLNCLGADEVYSPNEMDNEESLKLFRWYAFKGEEILDEKFTELTEETIHYCGGLPLALQVIGSYLFHRDIPQWKCTLEKLQTIPNNDIQKRLKLSFDGLDDDSMKDIFLDISCFLIGMDKDDVIRILDGCGFFPRIGLDVLVERCLITIDMRRKLRMHDLLRDMGREIVREISPKEPEERTRLWLMEDVLDVLRKKMGGTKTIEGILLKMPESDKAVNFHVKALRKMKNLRLLQLAHVQLSGDYEYLSKELRWLLWRGFPLKSIPSNLYQEKLVAIDFRYSNLKVVWKHPQLLVKLKMINLSHSHSLIQTPDFSFLPNLEKLILKDCSNLTTIHETIGDLKGLVTLNLKNCKSLRNLPRSLYKLKSLKYLIFSSCPLIDTLEEHMEQMASLQTLDARDTPIKRVPFSIIKLRSLKFISLCGYEGSASDLFPRLISSWMLPKDNPSCKNLSPESLFLLSNSFLSGLCEKSGTWLDHPFQMHQTRDLAQALNILYSSNSHTSEKFLKTLVAYIGSCNDVTTSITEGFLQGCDICLCGDLGLASDNHGSWFSYKDQGPSVCFEVPPIVGPILEGVNLCITFSSNHREMHPEHHVCVINHSKCSICILKLATFKEGKLNENQTWENIFSNMEIGDRMEVIVDFSLEDTVIMTEVRLVYSMTKQLTMD